MWSFVTTQGLSGSNPMHDRQHQVSAGRPSYPLFGLGLLRLRGCSPLEYSPSQLTDVEARGLSPEFVPTCDMSFRWKVENHILRTEGCEISGGRDVTGATPSL
mmetsp:Transcript_15229/g.37343  ORF Transcript_15229/g.37343 Transcript_15229/m.37343 type:complete len:103 (-) Transcript_15229:65-373(-)